jgi:hypothetical protein
VLPDAHSRLCLQVKATVGNAVEALNRFDVSKMPSSLWPREESFSNAARESADLGLRHDHFQRRENHEEIETILQGPRPGLSSIVAKATNPNAEHAALLSGAVVFSSL